MSENSDNLAVAWGVLVTLVTLVIAAYVSVTEGIWKGIIWGFALWLFLGGYAVIKYWNRNSQGDI